MRHLFSTTLAALSVITAPAGAQRARIILAPEITYGAEHEIYRGLLYARLFSGDNYFEHGWIELSSGARYGLRAEVLTGSRSWGAFASYSARDAEMRSGGDEPQASFRLVQNAEAQVFTAGVVRQLRLGTRAGPIPAPDLRVGLAATVMRVRAEGRMPPLNWIQVRDFLSPGGQVSVGVIQRIGGTFDVRVQGGYALVRHDTEGLDGGGLPGAEPTLGHWASALDVGLGVGVSF